MSLERNLLPEKNTTVSTKIEKLDDKQKHAFIQIMSHRKNIQKLIEKINKNEVAPNEILLMSKSAISLTHEKSSIILKEFCELINAIIINIDLINDDFYIDNKFTEYFIGKQISINNQLFQRSNIEIYQSFLIAVRVKHPITNTFVQHNEWLRDLLANKSVIIEKDNILRLTLDPEQLACLFCLMIEHNQLLIAEMIWSHSFSTLILELIKSREIIINIVEKLFRITDRLSLDFTINFISMLLFKTDELIDLFKYLEKNQFEYKNYFIAVLNRAMVISDQLLLLNNSGQHNQQSTLEENSDESNTPFRETVLDQNWTQLSNNSNSDQNETFSPLQDWVPLSMEINSSDNEISLETNSNQTQALPWFSFLNNLTTHHPTEQNNSFDLPVIANIAKK